jgi:hypothetical protein
VNIFWRLTLHFEHLLKLLVEQRLALRFVEPWLANSVRVITEICAAMTMQTDS